MSAPVLQPKGIDLRNLRKLAIGILLGAILFLLPTPEGLSDAGHQTLALFAVIVFLWATEALPLPVTALLAGVGLVVLGIADNPNQAWGPYAQDTIFFLLGSLILADAVTKTDTDRLLAARFLKRVGGRTDTLLLGIVTASTAAAAIISSHAVAAVMVPLVLSILRATGLVKRRNIAASYMLAIAFGTGIAGLATPSAGSRNAIVLGYLDQDYGIKISYLDWMLHATPITIALIPVTYLILKVVFKVPRDPIEARLPGAEDKLNVFQQRTLLIIAATVAMWIFLGDTLGLGTVAIIGSVLLFVFGILDWVDTRRRIAWGVPLIYGAALTMGAAMQATGAAQWLAQTLLGLGFAEHESWLLLGVLALTVVLTNIMSDGGTAAAVAPVTLSLAALGGFDVAAMGLVTALGSAFSFMLVVGTPPNVITHSSGLFTARDLARAGFLLTVASLIVTALAVQFYWPLLP